MENSLRRLLGDTLMDVMVDVPLVSSCRIMTGRYAGIDKNLIIQLNNSDATFDEIAA